MHVLALVFSTSSVAPHHDIVALPCSLCTNLTASVVLLHAVCWTSDTPAPPVDAPSLSPFNTRYYGLVQLVPQLEFVAGEHKECKNGHLMVPVSY